MSRIGSIWITTDETGGLMQWCSRGRMSFLQIFFGGNAVPPNDIRTRLAKSVSSSFIKMSGLLAHSDTTQQTRHISNNNWHTAGQILDASFVFHHLDIISVFKLFIFTEVKNIALNKERVVLICLDTV